MNDGHLGHSLALASASMTRIYCKNCNREYDSAELEKIEYCEDCGIKLSPETIIVKKFKLGLITNELTGRDEYNFSDDDYIFKQAVPLKNHRDESDTYKENLCKIDYTERIRIRKHEISTVKTARVEPIKNQQMKSHILKAYWVKAA